MNGHPRDERRQNLWIGFTDNDWFAVVSGIPNIDEVNFWQPGGGSHAFRSLQPSEPFCFKLQNSANYYGIGCWENDFPTCPVEIIEIREEIK